MTLTYPQRRPARLILKPLNSLALRLVTRFEVTGRENLPKSGPLLLVANHFSHIDPMIMLHVAPWPVEFLGGFNLPHAPRLVRFLPRMYGYYPVYRGTPARDSLRIAEKILKGGGNIGLFPEGGSWTDVLRPARPGAAFLAVQSGARILPMGFEGAEYVMPNLNKFQRARLRVRIGKPFGPFTTTRKGRARRAELNEIGDEIMAHIADLLPEEKRGMYSDDPALRAEAEKVAAYPWDGLTEQQITDGEIHYH